MTYRDHNGRTNWAVVLISIMQVVVVSVTGYLIYRIDANSMVLSHIASAQAVNTNVIADVKLFVQDHDRKTEEAAIKSGRTHHVNDLPPCGACHNPSLRHSH